MIPAGYMAKRVAQRPEFLRAPNVREIYSVSGCISSSFADYVICWRHNSYWLFDSPQIIRGLAKENCISLDGTSLFYYEVYPLEFEAGAWMPYEPGGAPQANVVLPAEKRLRGYDVVSFCAKALPECSPLSCNSLAESVPVNARCLFDSFEEAETNLARGAFTECEPGPYRIFAVYSVDWP